MRRRCRRRLDELDAGAGSAVSREPHDSSFRGRGDPAEVGGDRAPCRLRGGAFDAPPLGGGGGFMMDRKLAPAVLAVLLAALPAFALSPVNKSLFGGVAIDGYDPVAYFTDGKPVEGKKEFQTTWNGATWRFASAEHRDLFVKDPTHYAPQYGGYCAWAVAQNDT